MPRFSVSKALLTTALAAITGLALSSTASAQSIVLGDGDAHQCYMKVKLGDMGRKSSIKLCQRAIDEAALTKKDRASTHVNLGILQMRRKDFASAEKNYHKALKIRPDMPEVFINLAANEIYQGRYDEALGTVNKAIDLGTAKMPEALFNRAMIYDRQQRYALAYKDIKQALVLRPEWEPALKKLDNYVVSPKRAS